MLKTSVSECPAELEMYTLLDKFLALLGRLEHLFELVIDTYHCKYRASNLIRCQAFDVNALMPNIEIEMMWYY